MRRRRGPAVRPTAVSVLVCAAVMLLGAAPAIADDVDPAPTEGGDEQSDDVDPAPTEAGDEQSDDVDPAPTEGGTGDEAPLAETAPVVAVGAPPVPLGDGVVVAVGAPPVPPHAERSGAEQIRSSVVAAPALPASAVARLEAALDALPLDL